MYKAKPAPKLRDNPRLNDRGKEILDPISAVAEIQFRPMTDFERLQRLASHSAKLANFLPDDEFSDDDDFHDHLDDLPPEGLTPYEISEMRFTAPYKPVQKKKENPLPSPSPNPVSPPVAPQIANGGPSSGGD